MKKFIAVIAIVVTAGTYVYGMKYFHSEPKIVIKKQAQTLLSQEDQIKIIIKRNLKDIQKCYEQRLEEGLERNGKLKISWNISENGVPSNFMEENNQLNDTELFDCSSKSISKWKFPNGIPFQINYTFNLKQKERKTASTVTSTN